MATLIGFAAIPIWSLLPALSVLAPAKLVLWLVALLITGGTLLASIMFCEARLPECVWNSFAKTQPESP